MKMFAGVMLAIALAAAPHTSRHSADFRGAEAKFARIDENANKQAPEPDSTVINDAELNAYLNEGGVELPKGVRNVVFTSAPGSVTATAEVDFDRLTEGRHVSGLWMMLFSGVHDVKVNANAGAENGVGEIHVQTMELDGVPAPRAALQFLVDRFLKPKYGENVGLDTRFKMPAQIDHATLEERSVKLEQK